jgi:hypothetical protein
MKRSTPKRPTSAGKVLFSNGLPVILETNLFGVTSFGLFISKAPVGSVFELSSASDELVKAIVSDIF